MAQIFDFDPLTGVQELYAYDHEKDRALIHSQIDMEPLIERNKRLANEGATDKPSKEGWNHYATITPIQQLEMKKEGINPYPRSPDEWRAFFRWINARPYLKTTHKTHL